jgi:hypothetical protein
MLGACRQASGGEKQIQLVNFGVRVVHVAAPAANADEMK